MKRRAARTGESIIVVVVVVVVVVTEVDVFVVFFKNSLIIYGPIDLSNGR